MKKHVLKILVVAAWWGVFGWLVTTVPPAMVANVLVEGLYLPFFAGLSTACYFTFDLFLQSWWRSMLITLGIVGQFLLLLLRIWTLWSFGASIIFVLFVLWLSYRNSTKESESNYEKNSQSKLHD